MHASLNAVFETKFVSFACGVEGFRCDYRLISGSLEYVLILDSSLFHVCSTDQVDIQELKIYLCLHSIVKSYDLVHASLRRLSRISFPSHISRSLLLFSS